MAITDRSGRVVEAAEAEAVVVAEAEVVVQVGVARARPWRRRWHGWRGHRRRGTGGW